MSKDEFEAIESVNEYLLDVSTNYALQLNPNTKTLEECNQLLTEWKFWHNSYKKYNYYYLSAFRQYYNLKK